jgi:hypothetical protein
LDQHPAEPVGLSVHAAVGARTVIFDIALGESARSGDTEQDHSEDAESYKSLFHGDMLLASNVTRLRQIGEDGL